ncbi:hypothetical protein [Cupriavidus pauculus]|uniref:hypothetical protein n=1 Tax=Cupriavidus pauculus TaxID=82633 RepID=UPI0007821389|nr:hypothetical protein [Cupriavidus pauculus]
MDDGRWIYQSALDLQLEGVVGLAQATVTAYSTHYHRLDMLAHVAMRQDAGNWLDSDEALPRQELLRSEFYTDYLNPHGQAQILALMIKRNEHGLCAMAFQRSRIEQGARQRLASDEAGIFVGALPRDPRWHFPAMVRSPRMSMAASSSSCGSSPTGKNRCSDPPFRWTTSISFRSSQPVHCHLRHES